MKKALLNLLKIALPAALIWWLLSRIEPQQLEMLQTRPKNWTLLGLAFAMSFAAVSITFLRWWLLVCTLGLTFRIRDAFRLGFLCYLLNFVSIGGVGGDLFKAVFIAREQPGKRGHAVATVLVDRIVGLYALLLVAAAAILVAGIPDHPGIRFVCQMTLVLTLIGGVGLVLLMLPTLTSGRFSRWAEQLPWVGKPLAAVIDGVRLYKSRPLTLVLVALSGVVSHTMFAVAIYLIAASMFEIVPGLLDHLVMVPMAMIANALPLTPGGLGAMEVALDELYRQVPATPHDASGVLVTLVYRLTTIAIAAVGVVFYFSSRKQVQQVLQQAEADRAVA